VWKSGVPSLPVGEVHLEDNHYGKGGRRVYWVGAERSGSLRERRPGKKFFGYRLGGKNEIHTFTRQAVVGHPTMGGKEMMRGDARGHEQRRTTTIGKFLGSKGKEGPLVKRGGSK